MQYNETYHPEELSELYIYETSETYHRKSLEELREMPDSPTIILYMLMIAMLFIYGLFENRH